MKVKKLVIYAPPTHFPKFGNAFKSQSVPSERLFSGAGNIYDEK